MSNWKKRRTRTTFGMMVEVGRKIDTELMVVCTNDGGGWKPQQVLLPHQLYVHDIAEWRKQDPRIYEVACFPLKHDSFVTVWRAR